MLFAYTSSYFTEFRNETEYTEWSECTKTCGMGIQSRASKNGEQTQSRFCNTDQCPGMIIYHSCAVVHNGSAKYSLTCQTD